MTEEPWQRLESRLASLGPDRLGEQLGPSAGDEAIDSLLDLARRRLQSAPTMARDALAVAVQLAPGSDRPDAIPAAHYLSARMALNDGRPDAALDLIVDAKNGWLTLERPIDACRTELGRMAVLDDLGRHREALAVAEDLLTSLDGFELDDLDEATSVQLEWIRAATQENIGVACGFTGRHEQALEAYRRAEATYRSVGGTADMARCRANRGVELVATGRAIEGLAVLEAAAADFNTIGDKLSYGQCLGHVVDAELLLGRYAACLAHFEEARRVLDELEASSEAARLRLRCVRAYLALNLVDEAELLAGQTEELLAELGLPHDLAEARWLRATAKLRAGNPEEALALLDLAEAGALASEDPPLRIRALVSKSEAMSSLGRREEALTAAYLALAAGESGEWPAEELQVRLRLADVIGPVAGGGHHLERARSLADELALPHLRYPVLLQLGLHHRAIGELTTARHHLDQAIAVVEGLRGMIGDEAVRTSYLECHTGAHVELISMLVASNSPEDHLRAFAVAESSKARTLADLLAGTLQPVTVGATSALPTAARHQGDLDAAYSALAAGGGAMTTSRRRAVHDRAIELERNMRLARVGIDPTTQIETGDREELQVGRPDPGEQVIEYHIVDGSVVAFVWSRGELRVVTDLASASEVGGLLERWDQQRQRFLTAKAVGGAASGQLVASAEEVLRRLWVAVFGPVVAHLEPDREDVLVVPHGPLHAVPFHALVGPDGPVDRWLTITLAPSYAVSSQLGGRPGAAPVGRSLVVGVPDGAAPAVETEAGEIAELLPGAELLLGPDATVEALTGATSQPHDVVHLACHGLHRDQNPMFSALKLADRWLTAADVMGMRVPARLVVLSACESGRNRDPQTAGEAIGLARSFMAAGAGAVVVSLWLVDDALTARLMGHFHREVLAGHGPSSALRTARRSVASDHPHPAAWAPFVIHGTSDRKVPT